MAQTMHFTFGKNAKKNTVVRKATLDAASLKYGKSVALPDSEVHSVLIYTEDTGELFIGMGGGQPLKKLSNSLVFPTINDFPAPGVKQRLYVAEDTKSLYFWDGAQYQMIGGATGSTVTVTPRIFEYDDKADFPATGVGPAIYIEKNTGNMFRYDNGKYEPIGGTSAANSFGPAIQKLQNDVKDLQDKKAEKVDAVTAADVTRIAKAEVGKISIPDVSQFATRADIAKKADIASLALKADKADLAQKANVSDLAQKADKTDLANKADKTDLDLKADKAALDLKADKTDLVSKADKSDLNAYRKLSVAIEESDLSQALQDKLKNLPIEFATIAELDAAFDAAFGGGSTTPSNPGTLAFSATNTNIASLVSASELASGKLSATQIDCSAVTSLAGAFEGADTLTELPELANTTNVTDMSNAFKGMTKLQKAPTIDMSNVTNASGMFEGCTSLTEV